MENVFRVAAVIVPILVTVCLGMLSRRKNLITPEGVNGLQQFVLNIATSHWGGFSCCRAWALGLTGSVLLHTGSRAQAQYL